MDHTRIIDQEMEDLKEGLLKMGVFAQEVIHKSVNALKVLDVAAAEDAIASDQELDQLELEIDEKCIQMIALRQPEASDLRYIMIAARISTEIERIGDLAVDIAERAKILVGKPLLKPLIDIPKMADLCQKAIALVLDSFVKKESKALNKIWQMEEEVDRLRDAIYVELVEIMEKDPQSVSRAIPLLLSARHLERICDHATNIAEDIIYMVDAKVVKHGGSEK